VFSHKDNTIDLNTEYPCPCHRKGMLKPITLTEAMGCDKCQQIFVIDETGECLEQLASVSPSPRKWRWNGKNWTPWRQSIQKMALEWEKLDSVASKYPQERFIFFLVL